MGDIDRVAAQQAFIKALADQKLNAGIITRLPELFKTVQSNLRTNLTLSDITKYVINLSDLSSENVYMHALPGYSNGTDYGSSYWIADMEQLATLIRDTFGYDSSKITIHSADGKSASKDVKKASSNKAPEKTSEPSSSPKATATPKASEASKDTDTKKPTKAPASASPTSTPTPKATKTPVPTVPATASPTKTPTPTVVPSKKPAETVKPTTPTNEKTESGGIKRPAAN